MLLEETRIFIDSKIEINNIAYYCTSITKNKMNDETIDIGLETKKASPMKTSLKWGIIGGVLLIIFQLLKYLLAENYFDSNWVDYLVPTVLLILVIVMAQKEHRDNELNGRMTFGRALGVGVLVSLFAGILGAIYTFVFMNFILSPVEMEKFIGMAMEKGRESSSVELSDDAIEMQEKMVRFMFKPLILAGMGIFGTTFTGAIISLITGAIIHKN